MEDFYDKLNQKLSNEESLEGIHPERLWDKIEEELDNKRPLGGTPKTGGFKRRYWGILLLGLIIAITGLYFINTKTGVKKTAIVSPEVTPLSILKPKSQINKTKPNKSPISTNIQPNLKQAEVKDDSISSELEEVKKQEGQVVLSTSTTLEVSHYHAFSKNEKYTSDFPKPKNTKTTSSTVPVEELPKALEKVSTKDNLEVPSQSSWNALESITLIEQQEIETPKVQLEALAPQAVRIFRKPQLWSIEAGGGIHFASSYFRANSDAANFGTQLDSTYTPNMKYQFTLGVKRNINENIHLASGIEYHKTGQRFDIVQVRDSMIHNDSTGMAIPAKATRTVRNYNTISYLSLPLMLGWSQQKRRWEYGVRGGVSLNWIWNQQGKTILPNQEILAYSNKSSKLPHKKMFISYALSPYVNYYFTSQWAVQLRPHVSYQMHGTSPAWNVKKNALQGGVNVGIVWKW